MFFVNKTTAVYFLLVLPLFANAQKPDSTFTREYSNTITLPGDSGVIYFHTAGRAPKALLSDACVYASFHNQALIHTRGAYGGKLLHGPYTEVYESTQRLKMKGDYYYGLKDGIWKEWYPQGELKRSVPWNKGIKNGTFTEYTPDGRKTRSGTYKNNELNGRLYVYEADTSYTRNYRKGQLVVPGEKKAREKKEKKKEEKEPDVKMHKFFKIVPAEPEKKST
jgi:hypothetical protein